MPKELRAGFPVHWRDFGTGPDHAVLLHCALASSKAWTGLAERLGDRLRMIAPDMPGHGRSARWDHRCDMHDQVTAIARDCLGAGGHVIGHSFGATVALRLAIEVPDLVHSVTLIEPVLFAAARETDPAVFQRYLDSSRDLRAALANGKTGPKRPSGSLAPGATGNRGKNRRTANRMCLRHRCRSSLKPSPAFLRMPPGC